MSTNIGAAERKWNSATTLYIARRLANIADGRRIRVLDMGCGTGVVMEQLSGYGFDLYGYDLGHREQALKGKHGFVEKEMERGRIRVVKDERRIPFDGDFFDVIYANQVFEHIKFLDCMLAECARVLREGGVLLANFPLATYPVEGHLKVPFAHWIPPGRLRIWFLSWFYFLGIRRREKGQSARQAAVQSDTYLREKTYYRFINEIKAVAGYYFESCELETGEFIRAKIDLLCSDPRPTRRLVGRGLGLFEGNLLSQLVTYSVNAAFCITGPRKHVRFGEGAMTS